MCTEKTSGPSGHFYSIVLRELGDLNIVMAGEVDCAELEGTPQYPSALIATGSHSSQMKVLNSRPLRIIES